MSRFLLEYIIRKLWEKIWEFYYRSLTGDEIWDKYMFIWGKYNFNFDNNGFSNSPLTNCLLELNKEQLNKLLIELKLEVQKLIK